MYIDNILPLFKLCAPKLPLYLLVMPPTKSTTRRPTIRTTIGITHHPSTGNGHAYIHECCLFVDYVRMNILENNPIITHAQQINVLPSIQMKKSTRTKPNYERSSTLL